MTDRLTTRLESRSLVKCILGLTNFDVAAIAFLTQIYARAGADVIDVAADPRIVQVAHAAIEEARNRSPGTAEPPALMISLALERDPHVVEAALKPAQRACVVPETTQALVANVEACLELGADAVELHGAASDETSLAAAVAALDAVLGDRYLSVCLGTQGATAPAEALRQAKATRDIHGGRTIIQAEGIAATGYATAASSLQGMALAQVLLADTPCYVIVAGSANHWTRHLADLLDVPVHGVGTGTYARGLIPTDTDPDRAEPAIRVARAFVEQLRGTRP